MHGIICSTPTTVQKQRIETTCSPSMTYCKAMRTSYTCIAQRQLIHTRSSRPRSMIAARSDGETFLLLSRALKLMAIATSLKQRRRELRLHSALNHQTTYHLISCK